MPIRKPRLIVRVGTLQELNLMKINDYKYKGFTYSLHFAHKEGDWGKDCINTYYTESNYNFDGGHNKDFDIVKQKIEGEIDSFLSEIPKTIGELVSLIDSKIVCVGYGEPRLDLETIIKELEAISPQDGGDNPS